MPFTHKFLLFNILFALSINAKADPLSEYCTQKAIETSLELKAQKNVTLSNDDIKIARMAAKHTCIKIYTRLEAAPPNTPSISTNSEPKNNEDSNRSIWERLTESSTRKDVNPMIKKHRTGGK